MRAWEFMIDRRSIGDDADQTNMQWAISDPGRRSEGGQRDMQARRPADGESTRQTRKPGRPLRQP
jgi:hypothetical protein